MQLGLLEMLLFCHPKPTFFSSQAGTTLCRRPGERLERSQGMLAAVGQLGCRYCHKKTRWGQDVHGGDGQRNPWRGKGPGTELICRVALPQSSSAFA